MEEKQIKDIRECEILAEDIIFDNIAELAFVTNADYQIITCNKAMISRLGMPYQEIKEKHVYKVFFDDQPPSANPFAEGSREVNITKLNATFLIKNNRIPTKKFMVHVMIDITEHKKIAELSSEREKYYRTLAERLPIGVYIEQDGCFQWVNSCFHKNTGYLPEEILGRPCISLVHPDDREALRRNAVAMLRGDSLHPYEYRCITKNGDILWCMETVVSMDVNNRRAILGNQMDITKLKNAEKKLQHSERLLRDTHELSKMGAWEFDLRTLKSIWSEEVYRIRGITPSADNSPGDLEENISSFTPEYRDTIRQAYSRTVLGEPFDVVAKILTPQEEIKWVRSKGKPIMSDGQVVKVYGYIMDITEHKQVEERLRSSEERYRTIIETIPDSYFEVDLAGRNIFCNEQYAKNMGYTAEEIKKLQFRDILDSKNFELLSQACSEVYRTGIPAMHVQLEWFDKAGKLKVSELSISLIRDPQGKPVGFRGIARDITEKREQEILAFHSQKLEAVGQLAAGIAHEINTPIQFVGDNMHFMQDAFHDIMSLTSLLDTSLNITSSASPAIKELIGRIHEKEKEIDLEYLRIEIPKAILQSLEGLQRVSKIVQAMREFSHPGGESMVELDINRAIESTITLTRNEWKYSADLTASLDPGLPLAKGYPADFSQVILNIIVNAAQAIQEKVTTDGAGKGQIKIATRLDGNEAEICIRDTGPGIPKDVQSRIFDPFFTTKAVGKGTGQGLAIAQNIIVRKHGGKIYCETTPGEGTAFYIRLPLDGK